MQIETWVPRDRHDRCGRATSLARLVANVPKTRSTEAGRFSRPQAAPGAFALGDRDLRGMDVWWRASYAPRGERSRE